MTSPDTGQASAAHEGEAIDVARRTATRSKNTVLHRRHRTTDNLPDDGTPVKGHVSDLATNRVSIITRIVPRSTAPVYGFSKVTASYVAARSTTLPHA